MLDLVDPFRAYGRLGGATWDAGADEAASAPNHAFNYQVVSGDNRAISAYKNQA
jgi:hypothetical protein